MDLTKTIKEQRHFVDRELLTQWLLEFRQSHSKSFKKMFDAKVSKHYKLDTKSPEYFWENISSFVYDIDHGDKRKFGVKSGKISFVKTNRIKVIDFIDLVVSNKLCVSSSVA